MALYCSLFSVILVLVISYIALLLYYIFNIKISYLLSENHVFPYVGDVIRVIGPLQPTSKLLSSFLTLSIGIVTAGLFVVSDRRLKATLFFVLFSAILIYPFTLSRGIVGFSLAITITFYFISKLKHYNLILPAFGVATGVVIFSITLFASSIYILDSKFDYKYDEKPSRDHTVYYYFHPSKGKETVSLNIGFARDHYYWLKKSAIIIFSNHLSGTGSGSYSRETLKLENQGLIPKGLSRHPTPQSELLYAAVERGWFGLLATILLFLSWLYMILRPLIIKMDIDPRMRILLIGAAVSIVSLCFIDAIHLEISRFRFLWAFSAVFIVMSAHTNFAIKNEN